MTLPGRDALEVDALRTDRYLEALLSTRDRHGDDAPADAGLDPDIRLAATRLSRDLFRVHPSFRFEERLAGRLAELADGLGMRAAAGGGATVPFGRRGSERPATGGAIVADRGLGPDLGELDALVESLAHPDPWPLSRPLLIGGALTSAALSLAGAAYVAWRRSRPPLSPMARAVRAARQSRLATRPQAGLRIRLE